MIVPITTLLGGAASSNRLLGACCSGPPPRLTPPTQGPSDRDEVKDWRNEQEIDADRGDDGLGPEEHVGLVSGVERPDHNGREE